MSKLLAPSRFKTTRTIATEIEPCFRDSNKNGKGGLSTTHVNENIQKEDGKEEKRTCKLIRVMEIGCCEKVGDK